MRFYPGFDIETNLNIMSFSYGDGVFGPEVEKRRLVDIRKSLLNSNCEGPEIVYSIAMDVGKEKDKQNMIDRNLLYGTVTYAAGRLGSEPIRSQGHIHAISKSCNSSTPEVYEIWSGKAIIYMQETAEDNPGRCFAVAANPGEVVIVPPGFAHCTISANSKEALTFGAWCVRDFGFEYSGVRKHNGLAWYPLLENGGEIKWMKNNSYEDCDLTIKSPREYNEFSIIKGIPIYTQFEEDTNKFLFVSNPMVAKEVWYNFVP
jgi:glucose-6-phosphate isomerase, archaeal